MNLKSSTKQLDLGSDPVGKLLFKLALPCITAQVINMLYNIVDRMYIGHIPESGIIALTGVGVTMPLIMAVSAFASLVCLGAAPRASIFLGRQDKEMAERILGNSACLLVVIALILTLIIEIFGQSLLMWFGASELTLPYSWDYIRIYGLGTLFVQLSIGLNAFINSQGYSIWGMGTILVGAICNIVLDPIFIFVFGMGVKGAALATIISQGVSALFVFWFLTSKHSYLHLERKYMGLSFKILGPCLALGFSPFVMQITDSLLMVCFNSSLLKYGGDLAVGSMTILNSVNQFSLLPLMGLAQGAQPILSYNLGAGKLERILKTFKLLLLSCLIYAWTFWICCELFPGAFARLFTENVELVEYTKWSLRIFIFGCGFLGIQVACQQTFVSLGNAKTSVFLAFLRKIFLLIPLIYILPLFFTDKTFAVFLAEPVADILSGCTSGLLFFRYAKKKLPELVKANQAIVKEHIF